MGMTIGSAGGPQKIWDSVGGVQPVRVAAEERLTLTDIAAAAERPLTLCELESEPRSGILDSAVSVRQTDYARQRMRAIEVLGEPGSAQAAAAINFSLPGRRVTSRQFLEAIEKIDLSVLRDAGIDPVACLDFDNTIVAGDVLFAFLRYASARGLFPEIARPAVICELRSRRPDLATREQTRGKTVDELLEVVVDRFEAGDLCGADAYHIAMRAFRGMTREDVVRIGEELFDEGLPGQGPYWGNAFDPTPESGDSALEIVEAFRAKGLRVAIVTAGLVDLARIGARYFGVAAEDVVGGELYTADDGRLTGAAEDVGLIGKDELICERVGGCPVFVMGDSWETDGRMLPEAMVKGFIVGDDPKFENRSREAGYDFVTIVYEPES